jgi:hypothetical protein
MVSVLWLDASRFRRARRPPIVHLERNAALGVRGALPAEEAEELAARVVAAEDAWTHDFNGEQFALGRAFYTHLETGKTKAYFEGARQSDDLVERTLPGMQERTLALLARALGGTVLRRRGFCGPGVHVFPSGGTVARKGGVIHYDLEGLTDQQLTERARAVTLVWMLRAAVRGGGLRLFDVLYDGRPDSEIAISGRKHETVLSHPGDALFIDGYRLHQIRPFTGSSHRISITVHAVEIDRNVWEAWF